MIGTPNQVHKYAYRYFSACVIRSADLANSSRSSPRPKARTLPSGVQNPVDRPRSPKSPRSSRRRPLYPDPGHPMSSAGTSPAKRLTLVRQFQSLGTCTDSPDPVVCVWAGEAGRAACRHGAGAAGRSARADVRHAFGSTRATRPSWGPHESRHPGRRPRHAHLGRIAAAPEADDRDRRAADPLAHHEDLRASRHQRLRRSASATGAT